jgi:hypothetical protein
MRAMLDDMDLAVLEVECLSMGRDEGEKRYHLVKFSQY